MAEQDPVIGRRHIGDADAVGAVVARAVGVVGPDLQSINTVAVSGEVQALIIALKTANREPCLVGAKRFGDDGRTSSNQAGGSPGRPIPRAPSLPDETCRRYRRSPCSGPGLTQMVWTPLRSTRR